MPLRAHSLPTGFGYQHEISESEASNTTAFDTRVDARDLRRCVVCGKKAREGPHPGVHRAHIIDKTEYVLWNFRLKNTGFIPPLAKSVKHEPRNGINLCNLHHRHFDGYRFFVRWVPSARVFVFVNFSQHRSLEQFHGKTVALDPNRNHSPFPAAFLIHEMRTRGFHPWCADRSIPCPLSPTYTLVDNGGGGGVAGFGGGSGAAEPGGSDTDESDTDELGGSGGASSSSGPSSTGINQQYLVLSNPFRDPELLESMRRQWQQLPNWKSATVEGSTWEGTAEENARKYVDLFGLSTL
ncbi:hypothetical protein F5887DRAFT_1077528 [Amanita rubescens]|nr:hypothetical protein F5887DRAFT_1077528 [Amanita rubescens]